LAPRERPTVVVTRASLPGNGLTRLGHQTRILHTEGRGAPSFDELAPLLKDADGLLSISTERIDAQLLDAAPSLRVIAQAGVGVDNFDIGELTRRGIAAGNSPGVLSETVADLTFALILAAARRVTEAHDYVRRGEWRSMPFDFMLGLDVYGATLGIVGYGSIGKAVARRAHGFSMSVVHYARNKQDDELSTWVPLDELLRTADIVTIHTPLTPQTERLIGPRELALMKPTAVLVNTSRGGVVDQVALTAALRERRIFAAGLDVLAVEPIEPDDPLLELSNCLVLPHIGSASIPTRARMVDLAVDNILAGLAGQPLPHCVNPEVYRSTLGRQAT